MLLSREFVKWVILANLIALPAAYYFMSKWLQDFAYKIELTWWIFALAGGIALIIALATVSFQAIKAATANPVKSLRYEQKSSLKQCPPAFTSVRHRTLNNS